METGTIVKLVPNVETRRKIKEVMNLLNVENCINQNDLHLTVVISRQTCSNIEEMPVKFPIIAKGTKFDIFRQADGANCLVVRLEGHELHQLHNECITNYDAIHNYPEYHPHITLSYDYPSRRLPHEVWMEQFEYLEFDAHQIESLDFNYGNS